MGPCILILTGHLSRSDWLVRRATANARQLKMAETALYSGRQLLERIEAAGESEAAVDDVLLLDARMALADVYRAIEELTSSGESGGSPVVVVSPDAEGSDRIARGYIHGMAQEDVDQVSLKRFSKRIEAPSVT